MSVSVGTRILMAVGIALLALVAISWVAYQSTDRFIRTSDEVRQSYHVVDELEDLLTQILEVESGNRGYLLTGDSSFLATYDLGARRAPADLQEIRSSLAGQSAETANLTRLDDLVRRKLAAAARLVETRRAQGAAPAARLLQAGGSKQLTEQIRQLVDTMEADQRTLLQRRDQAAQASGRNATAFILWGSLLALAVASIGAFGIQRSITQPLGAFVRFVQQVGQGDLTQQAVVAGNDELSSLGRTLNQMSSGLREVAIRTRGATENLNAAAAEILASTQEQAASSREQAAAVQETTATMQELSQSGAQISEKAREVAASAEATSTVSNAGLHAIQNTTRSMDGIQEQATAVAENIVSLSEKTQAVGEIIATVNEIAEQSNLLALNAAIEAAAAGEQGRSFSVVANEMKNLADQSKQATVQVRSILGDIQKGINTSVMLTEEAVKRVDAGRQQVDVADQTIRQMAESILQSIQAFQQIVAATSQQQIGFEQVTQAIMHIRQATEQTIAGTNQLEKAAASLTDLGHQLTETVRVYRT
jgi:methyl-accepting chemotaxis protein